MKSNTSAVSSAQFNSTQLKKDIIASIFFLSIFIPLGVLASKIIKFTNVLFIFWTVSFWVPFVMLIIITLTFGILTIPLIISLYRLIFKDRPSLFDDEFTKQIVITAYLLITAITLFTVDYNYSGINYNRSINQQPFIWRSIFTTVPENWEYYVYITMQNDNIWTDITALNNIDSSFKSIDIVKSKFIKKFSEVIKKGEVFPSKIDITDDNNQVWHVEVKNVTIEKTYMKLK